MAIKDKLMIKFCLICCFLTTASFFVHAYFQNYSSLNVVSEVVFSLNNNWQYSINGEEYKPLDKLPASIGRVYRGDEVVITNTLPVSFVDGMSMLFYNELSSFYVEIDGEEIYSYGENVNEGITKSLGSSWNLIALKKEWEGKPISIHYYEAYDRTDAIIPEFLVGTYADCMAYHFVDSAFSLFMSITLFAISFLILVVFGYIYLNSNKKIYSILYLSLFGFIASLYSFAETNSFQLIFPYPYLIHLLTFLCLPLLPVPLVCYVVDKYRPVHEKALRESIYLMTLNIVIVCVLPFFGVDLYESVIVSHICILVTVLRVTYVIVTEIFEYHNKDMYLLGAGCLAIIVYVIFNLFKFYTGVADDFAYGLRVAFFFLIILLTYKEIKQLTATEALLQHHNKELQKAYYDCVTGCLVHNQFQYRIKEIQENSSDYSNFVVVIYSLIELNDNDNFSEVRNCLCEFVSQIREVFTDVTDLYRVGSTSFAMVFEHADIIQLSHRIELLNENLNALKAENSIYEYSYSYDYYSGQDELLSVFYRAIKKMNNRTKIIIENKKAK